MASWQGRKKRHDEAEAKFADAPEAHEVLSNDELRVKCDRSEEVFENQGGGGARHHNPSDHFQKHFHHGGAVVPGMHSTLTCSKNIFSSDSFSIYFSITRVRRDVNRDCVHRAKTSIVISRS